MPHNTQVALFKKCILVLFDTCAQNNIDLLGVSYHSWVHQGAKPFTVTGRGAHQVVRLAPIKATFGKYFVRGTSIQLISPLGDRVISQSLKG